MQCLSRYRTGKSQKVKEYTNSQIEHLIDEYIHSERDRRMLRRRLIDGLTFDQLAEESNYSVRQTKTIIYRAQEKVFKHL